MLVKLGKNTRTFTHGGTEYAIERGTPLDKILSAYTLTDDNTEYVYVFDLFRVAGDFNCLPDITAGLEVLGVSFKGEGMQLAAHGLYEDSKERRAQEAVKEAIDKIFIITGAPDSGEHSTTIKHYIEDHCPEVSNAYTIALGILRDSGCAVGYNVDDGNTTAHGLRGLSLRHDIPLTHPDPYAPILNEILDYCTIDGDPESKIHTKDLLDLVGHVIPGDTDAGRAMKLAVVLRNQGCIKVRSLYIGRKRAAGWTGIRRKDLGFE